MISLISIALCRSIAVFVLWREVNLPLCRQAKQMHTPKLHLMWLILLTLQNSQRQAFNILINLRLVGAKTDCWTINWNKFSIDTLWWELPLQRAFFNTVEIGNIAVVDLVQKVKVNISRGVKKLATMNMTSPKRSIFEGWIGDGVGCKILINLPSVW